MKSRNIYLYDLEKSIRRTLSVVIFLFSFLRYGIAADAARDESELLHQIVGIESTHQAICIPSPGEVDLRSSLDLLTRGVATGPVFREGGLTTVESLNRLIFEQSGISASADLKNPCNLLPSRVLVRKQGYCVGIAAIYLTVAERLHLPIFAVATPSHVFLRYDDGKTKINIETMQGGADIPDEQYVREQKIPEESIHHGVFMRNLTTDEFLAQVHNNLGVIYSERREFEKAAREYEEARDLDPRLPATCYNYGNDLLRTGKHRRAARLFSKSLSLYPTDVWAFNNRGWAYLKMGKLEKARGDFEEALRLDPAFGQALRGLEELKRRSSAGSSQPIP